MATWTATRSFPPATLIFSAAIDSVTDNIYGNVPDENGAFVLSQITATRISTEKRFPSNLGAAMSAATILDQVYYVLTFDTSGNRSISSVDMKSKQMTTRGSFSGRLVA